MIELIINNQLADVSGNEKITLSKSFNRTSGGGEYSYSFELPITPNNQKIFGFANKLETSGKRFNSYKADLFVNSDHIFSGNIIVFSANDGFYSVNLSGGVTTNLEDIFSDKDNVKDIRLGGEFAVQLQNPLKPKAYPNEWIYDISTSYALNRRGVKKAWIYPFAMWSHPYNMRNNNFFGLYRNEQAATSYPKSGDILPISQAEQILLPFFNVPDVIRSLFASKGYGVEGSFFAEDSVFKNLYESFAGNYETYLERHNQRFSARIYIDDLERNYSGTNRRGGVSRAGYIEREWEDKTFDFCTLTENSSGNSVVYKVAKVFSNLFDRNGKPYNKTHYEEAYTPRFKGEQDRMIKTNEDGEYIVRIPKSGWYKINMKGELINNFEVRKSGSILDYCSFDRNFFEITLTKNGTIRPFSGIYTNDSTCLGVGYVPTFEDGDIKMSMSHFLDNNGKAMPFSLNNIYPNMDASYSLMRTAAEKLTDNQLERFKGDLKYLSQFCVPNNEGTLFVDNEDFVCGVRVGNAFYNKDDGEQANANRASAGCLMNLPVIPTAENVGENKAIRYGVSGQGVKQNAYKYSSTFPKAATLSQRFATMRNNNGELMSTNFESDTHLGNTMLNMCNAKGFSQNAMKQPLTIADNSATSIGGLITDPLKVNAEDTLYNGEYYNSDLSNTLKVERQNYGSSVVSPQDKLTYNTNNVVYLEKGDEISAYIIAPAVKEDLDGDSDSYLMPNVVVKLDTQFEYIGESATDWRPVQGNSSDSDRLTYMHQYFGDGTCIEYINQFVSLFNLSLSIDTNRRVATIDYATKDGFSGVEDLTKYIDFGNYHFEPNNEPNKVTLSYQSEEGVSGVPSVVDDVLKTGNFGDEKEIPTKYDFPATEQIKVGNNGVFETPIICKQKERALEYPNTDIFDMSNAAKPRLYFWTGEYVTDFDTNARIVQICDATNKINFNNDLLLTATKVTNNTNRRWQRMTTKNGEIDLQRPVTILEQMHRTHKNEEQLVCKAFLPTPVYERLKKDTIIFVDGMEYDLIKVDNYNINGDQSCELTLIKR